MYQIIFIYAFIYRNYLTVVLIQHNIKSDIRPRFKDLDVSILVEHTAQQPNLCFVIKALALYRPGRTDSGGTLVEMRRVELLSKNLFISASPSADIYLHSLTRTPNVRLTRLVAPRS